MLRLYITAPGKVFRPWLFSRIGITYLASITLGAPLSLLPFEFEMHDGPAEPGYWPNACRFLQILWDTHRPIGTPPLWDDASQDRDAWRSFTQTWLSHRRLQPNTYYQDLHRVCLHGRCLLQVGSTFRLLPMRHEPIEPPYASPYIYLPTPKDDDDLQVIQVCSDGSSRNRKGGSAVAILPPYGDVSQATETAQTLEPKS